MCTACTLFDVRDFPHAAKENICMFRTCPFLYVKNMLQHIHACMIMLIYVAWCWLELMFLDLDYLLWVDWYLDMSEGWIFQKWFRLIQGFNTCFEELFEMLRFIFPEKSFEWIFETCSYFELCFREIVFHETSMFGHETYMNIHETSVSIRARKMNVFLSKFMGDFVGPKFVCRFACSSKPVVGRNSFVGGQRYGWWCPVGGSWEVRWFTTRFSIPTSRARAGMVPYYIQIN